MAQVRGTQTKTFLLREDVFGQLAAVPKAWIMYPVTVSVSPKQPLDKSNTLRPGREAGRGMQGNLDISGNMKVEASPENMGVLLFHALGDYSVAEVTGVFTHTFKVGELPVGFTLETDYGSTIVGAGRVEQYLGCKIKDFSLSAKSSGAVDVDFGIMGSALALLNAQSDPAPMDTDHSPFEATRMRVYEGGVELAIVTNAELKLDNDLDGDTFVVGGGGARRALNEGIAMVTGKYTMLFENRDLMNKAIEGTDSTAKIELKRGTGDGTVGNEVLVFQLNNIAFELAGAAIDGPKGLKVDVNFQAYGKIGSPLIEITLKNAIEDYSL